MPDPEGTEFAQRLASFFDEFRRLRDTEIRHRRRGLGYPRTLKTSSILQMPKAPVPAGLKTPLINRSTLRQATDRLNQARKVGILSDSSFASAGIPVPKPIKLPAPKLPTE